jgi:Family of unknown function (DUF6788)
MEIIPGEQRGQGMPVPEISKGKMSQAERDSRSRLAQLISGSGFMRGTLTVREKVCGKSSCKCARGEKHVALYLLSSKDGKLRQLFIPHSYEARVRKWLEQYKQVEELLEGISDLHWAKIKNREE